MHAALHARTPSLPRCPIGTVLRGPDAQCTAVCPPSEHSLWFHFLTWPPWCRTDTPTLCLAADVSCVHRLCCSTCLRPDCKCGECVHDGMIQCVLLLRWSALPLCCAAFLGLIMVTTDLRSSLPDHSVGELEPQCVLLRTPNGAPAGVLASEGGSHIHPCHPSQQKPARYKTGPPDRALNLRQR